VPMRPSLYMFGLRMVWNMFYIAHKLSTVGIFRIFICTRFILPLILHWSLLEMHI
jgi:hypothetical protein